MPLSLEIKNFLLSRSNEENTAKISEIFTKDFLSQSSPSEILEFAIEEKLTALARALFYALQEEESQKLISENSYEAFFYTILKNYSEMIKVFFECTPKGKHIDMIFAEEKTPLILAATYGCKPIVELLFEYLPSKKYAELIEYDDYKALRYAMSFDHKDVVEFLFDKIFSEANSEKINELKKLENELAAKFDLTKAEGDKKTPKEKAESVVLYLLIKNNFDSLLNHSLQMLDRDNDIVSEEKREVFEREKNFLIRISEDDKRTAFSVIFNVCSSIAKAAKENPQNFFGSSESFPSSSTKLNNARTLSSPRSFCTIS